MNRIHRKWYYADSMHNDINFTEHAHLPPYLVRFSVDILIPYNSFYYTMSATHITDKQGGQKNTMTIKTILLLNVPAIAVATFGKLAT